MARTQKNTQNNTKTQNTKTQQKFRKTTIFVFFGCFCFYFIFIYNFVKKFQEILSYRLGTVNDFDWTFIEDKEWVYFMWLSSYCYRQLIYNSHYIGPPI